MKIPIVIINGPLGSGKTSLIHELLKKHDNNNKVLWLKTEFGNESIDQYLLQNTGVQTQELVGGCICHVLLSDFDNVLEKIEIKNIDEIIIETSGMSHPAPVITTIKQHDLFYIKHIALIVDTSTINEKNYPKPMPLPKGSPTPYQSIVFNKYPKDLPASAEGALEKLLDPWYSGVYDSIEKFFIQDNVNSININQWAQYLNKSSEIKNIDTSNNMHIYEDHEGENIETKTIYFSKNEFINKKQFEKCICSAPDNIIRIKGVFQIQKNVSTAYNWVRGKGNWHELKEIPDKFMLILMGYDINKSQSFIDKISQVKKITRRSKAVN